MTENMKKLLEIVSASKELGVALTEADFVKTCELSDDELNAVVGGGGEYSDGSVRCVCIIGGDGNW